MAYLLLAVAQIAGLVLLPLHWIGIWLQLASLAAYAGWTDFEAVGAIPLAILLALTVLAETAWLLLVGSRIERKTRRRGMLAGLGGGLVGVLGGIVFPLAGSLFVGFAGALFGGLAGGWSPAPEPGEASRAGRAFGFAFRITAAFAIALVAFATLTS